MIELHAGISEVLFCLQAWHGMHSSDRKSYVDSALVPVGSTPYRVAADPRDYLVGYGTCSDQVTRSVRLQTPTPYAYALLTPSMSHPALHIPEAAVFRAANHHICAHFCTNMI